MKPRYYEISKVLSLSTDIKLVDNYEKDKIYQHHFLFTRSTSNNKDKICLLLTPNVSRSPNGVQ